MKIDSKIIRLVSTSLWPLLIFLVIPIFVILSVSLHVHLPFTKTQYPLLYNNACLTLFVAFRFLYYLQGITRAIRYGSCKGTPRQSFDIARPAGTVRSLLASSGYVFNSVGNYCEKRDGGYLGTMITYAGLFVVLLTGICDNMFQYSGMVLDGIGVSTDLNRVEAYRHLITGPMTRKPSTLPKIKILKQYIPDATYPRGAAEIAFILADGKEQTILLKASDTYRAGAYDIYMSKMVYEPKIAITIDNAMPVFNGQITLNQMPSKENGIVFHGTFVEGLLNGNVYYQPENSRLRVVVFKGNIQMLDTELIFQVDRLSKSANFSIMCEKMGVWTEIHVMHRRHMNIILLGGIVALIGFLMRIAIR